MPELPEVETVARSLSLTIKGASTKAIRFNRKNLRDEIPTLLVEAILLDETLTNIRRRGKYIICSTRKGHVIFHLGMSGSMLLRSTSTEQFPHTHVIFTFQMANNNSTYLHFIDPRRFGRITGSLEKDWDSHPLLSKLGPEPLGKTDLGLHLFECGKKSKRPIKTLIMDASIVVGVGNIYACESLFAARIRPSRPSCETSKDEYSHLATAIRKTLKKAISLGGTTLKDFKNLEGTPGYFSIELMVYGQTDKPCIICCRPIKSTKMGGRGTWFCSYCQK